MADRLQIAVDQNEICPRAIAAQGKSRRFGPAFFFERITRVFAGLNSLHGVIG